MQLSENCRPFATHVHVACMYLTNVIFVTFFRFLSLHSNTLKIRAFIKNLGANTYIRTYVRTYIHTTVHTYIISRSARHHRPTLTTSIARPRISPRHKRRFTRTTHCNKPTTAPLQHIKRCTSTALLSLRPTPSGTWIQKHVNSPRLKPTLRNLALIRRRTRLRKRLCAYIRPRPCICLLVRAHKLA